MRKYDFLTCEQLTSEGNEKDLYNLDSWKLVFDMSVYFYALGLVSIHSILYLCSESQDEITVKY